MSESTRMSEEITLTLDNYDPMSERLNLVEERRAIGAGTSACH